MYQAKLSKTESLPAGNLHVSTMGFKPECMDWERKEESTGSPN